MFARGSGQLQHRLCCVPRPESILIMLSGHSRCVFCRFGNGKLCGHLKNLSSEYRPGCNIAGLQIYQCKWLLICYGIKSVFRFYSHFCCGHIFRKLILHILPSTSECQCRVFYQTPFVHRLFALYQQQMQYLLQNR